MTPEEMTKLQEENAGLKKQVADLNAAVDAGVKENAALQAKLDKSQANQKVEHPSVTVNKKKYRCELAGTTIFNNVTYTAKEICANKSVAEEMVKKGVYYMVEE